MTPKLNKPDILKIVQMSKPQLSV